jgi:hypothetical protein
MRQVPQIKGKTGAEIGKGLAADIDALGTEVKQLAGVAPAVKTVEAATMADAGDRPMTVEEIKAQIAEAIRERSEAYLRRDAKHRRAAEHKQRTERINHTLGRGQGPERDLPWTILVRRDLKRQIKDLAKDLSEPKAKMSPLARTSTKMLGRCRSKDRGHGISASSLPCRSCIHFAQRPEI